MLVCSWTCFMYRERGAVCDGWQRKRHNVFDPITLTTPFSFGSTASTILEATLNAFGFKFLHGCCWVVFMSRAVFMMPSTGVAGCSTGKTKRTLVKKSGDLAELLCASLW